MRSPPGALAPKPPPTPMAKLQDDIQEIDILLEASKRARESVADRAKGLYEEHLATQRKFDLDMQRETLQKKPGMAGPRADHALMFHLGGNNNEDVPAAPGTALAGRGNTLEKVRERGFLKCGVTQGLPGFSNPDDDGNWVGPTHFAR